MKPTQLQLITLRRMAVNVKVDGTISLRESKVGLPTIGAFYRMGLMEKVGNDTVKLTSKAVAFVK